MPRKRRVLKKSKSGMEMEFFLLDNNGYMVEDSSRFMNIVNKKYPEVDARPDAGQSMVEIGSYPSVNVLDGFMDITEKIKRLLEVADENDYVLFPYATYPGKIKPIITNKRWYKEQAVMLGMEEYLNATICCGFHYHYTLPRGAFDHKKRFLREMTNSKIKQSMIDSYNLSIAMDPAITAFLQSSPFTQGKYLAKDSRMLMYRGGKKIGYMKGKYGRYPMFGALPPYKQTLNDLVFSLRRRQERWKELMIKNKLDPSWLITGRNVLDFTWNPVKINKIGTLEIRSADINRPKYTMAMASLLKFVFRQLYRDFYAAVPSDIGIKEPFKVEGNMVHIPPHTYVRNHLQRESAYKGFSSKEVREYCGRFLNFGKKFLDSNYQEVIRPLQEMLDKKKTVSDEIIDKFRKKGYGTEDEIPNDAAAEVSLKSCEKMLKEVDETEDKLYRAYNAAL